MILNEYFRERGGQEIFFTLFKIFPSLSYTYAKIEFFINWKKISFNTWTLYLEFKVKYFTSV